MNAETPIAPANGCPVNKDRFRSLLGRTNKDWWPDQLPLEILHQGGASPDPMGEDFDYASYGLKTAASIAGDEGFDYEELVAARVKEVVHLRDSATTAGIPMELIASRAYPNATDQLAAVVDAATPPPPAPTLEALGEGGTRNLVALLESVAAGRIPREQAVALLTLTFGYTQEAADRVVPPAPSLLVPPPEQAAPPPPPADAPGTKG